MKSHHSLTPYRKIISKWIIDILKVLEDNIGRIFSDINCSNIFFHLSPNIVVIEITKWACLNSKTFVQHRIGSNKQNEKTTYKMEEYVYKWYVQQGICLQLWVQLNCSVFATPWTPAYQASLSFTIAQSLLKLMSIGSVMPLNHHILCCPLLLLPSIFPSRGVFSSESALSISCPKYWSFSFSISPSNEYSGLISFKIVKFYFLAVQGTLRSLVQHHS